MARLQLQLQSRWDDELMRRAEHLKGVKAEARRAPWSARLWVRAANALYQDLKSSLGAATARAVADEIGTIGRQGDAV